ncbi:MAG: tandem-95 repeat protein [Xanthobacteraceae bacterium]
MARDYGVLDQADPPIDRITVPEGQTADRIVIANTHLLFSAKFNKSGGDLILTGEDGKKLVVTDYFKHERLPDLVAPGGAFLSGDLVERLAGPEHPGQYAQAGAPSGAPVIGRVERVGGTATVQHSNGVVEQLKVGDNILQGDIVETHDGSALGLSFIDGSAFNMGAGARMSINELVYDSNSTSNSAVFSLVRGAISFVAGQAAKTGDMRVETPVATMGIRGTTVSTKSEIDLNNPACTAAVDPTTMPDSCVVSFSSSLLTDPDGHVGGFNLINRLTNVVMRSVTTTDSIVIMTPAAGTMTTQVRSKSPEQVAQDLNDAQVLFPIFLANAANFNANVPQQDIKPQGPADHGSSTPPGSNTQTQQTTELPIVLASSNGTTNGNSTNNPPPEPSKFVIPPVVKFLPTVTTDTPPHLVEATSAGSNLADPGSPASIAHITKADQDGTVTYDTTGWVSVGNGIFSKDGVFGTAFLDTNANTLTYQLDETKADPLGPNNHPTESFVVNVVDNDNQHATTTVDFKIDGRNDPSTIDPDPGSPHQLQEAPGQTTSNSPHQLAGTLTFFDPEVQQSHTIATAVSGPVWSGAGNGNDIPTETVAAIATAFTAHIATDTTGTGYGEIAWNFDASDQLFDFLADGETLTLTYDVTVTDNNQPSHATSQTQTVTIVITGTNDQPVLSATTTGVFLDENTFVNISGIHVSDVDLTDNIATTFHVAHGTLAPLANGNFPGAGTDTITIHTSQSLDAAIAAGFRYTPNADYVGSDTLAIDVSDGHGGTQHQDIAITVNSTVGQPDTLPTTDPNGLEDVPEAVVLGGFDSDGTVTGFRIISVSGLHGTLFSDSNLTNQVNVGDIIPADFTQEGFLFVKPQANFNGDTSFTFAAIDNDGKQDSTPATATVHFTSVNDPPVASDDSYTATAGQPLASGTSILGNDTDIEGDSLTAILASQPVFGHVVLNSDGTFVYTPNGGFTGSDFFGYYAFDGHDQSNLAFVNITVNQAPNVPPDTSDAAASGDEDSTIAVTLSGTDSDGSVTSFRITDLTGLKGILYNDSGLTHLLQVGDLVSVGSGGSATVYFHPDQNSSGTSQFNFAAHDNSGAEDSTPAVATIDVQAVNDAPVFTGNSAGSTYLPGGPPVAVAANVLVDDVDNANFGGGSFTATITQGGHQGDVLSIADNAFISLNSTAVMFDADGAGAAFTPIVIGAVTDNLNSLEIDLNANADHAAIAALTQAITFQNTTATPTSDTRTITFTLVDGSGTADGGQDTGQFDAIVDSAGGTNQAPVSNNDFYATSENVTLNVSAPGVLLNDTDAENDPLFAFELSGPAHGTLTLMPDGSFFYSPDQGFVGTDTFTYAAFDGFSHGNPIISNNLIVNPGAELGPAESDFTHAVVPQGWTASQGWTSTSGFTAVTYAAGAVDPTFLGAADSAALGPPLGSQDGGLAYFAGGPANATSSIFQIIDVSNYGADIDLSLVQAILSADLGGYTGQEDNIVLTAHYLATSDNGSELGHTIIAGPTDHDPSQPNRQDFATTFGLPDATLLMPEGGFDVIPVGTRFIEIELTSNRASGSYNDGYADNLSLQLLDFASTGNVATVTVNVTGVNGAPVLADDTPQLNPITSNGLNSAGQSVASILGSDVTDPDGPGAGIAITDVSTAHGHWEYQLDGAGPWTTIAASDDAALLLRDVDFVRFVPNVGSNGSDSFTYHAWDQSDGLSAGETADLSSPANVGGSSAYSSSADTAAIDIFVPLGITGDLALQLVKGGSVTVTSLDLEQIAGSDPNATFTVQGVQHGHLVRTDTSQTLTVGSHFTQAQIDSGIIAFATDNTTYTGTGAGFSVSLSDTLPGSVPATAKVFASVFDAQINIATNSGVDFDTEDPISKMGAGVVTPDSADQTDKFTVLNSAANRDFTFIGSGFTYSGSGNAIGVTGGVLLAMQEFDHTTHAQIMNVTLNVPAADWYNAAVARAAGDHSVLETLTANWSIDFAGAGGADAFQSGDGQDFFSSSPGDDLSDGGPNLDRVSYANATGPINIQLADGVITGDASVGADTLRSIEIVSGTAFADTFNAGATTLNPGGFSQISTNAGSGSSAGPNTNEFEGRGGDDQITGNGSTRVSYVHATGAVTVDLQNATAGVPGSTGTADGDASVGHDTFFGGVNQVRGSAYGDTLLGSDNAFQTFENFDGRGGDDFIDGRGGFDRAVYFFDGPLADGVTGIQVDLGAGTVVGGLDTGSDKLRSVEAITGTNFNDTYDASTFTASDAGSPSVNSGNSGPGGAGSNFNEFEGAGGNDTITGNGNTRVAFYNATDGVVVQLTNTGGGTSDGASTGHDTIVSGVNAVRGSEYNDIILGGTQNETLEGRGGDDVLDGRGGNDRLIGGTGADIFAYDSLGNYRIDDFNRNEGDRIDLRGAGTANIGSLTFTRGTFANGTFTAGVSGPDTQITGFGSGKSVAVLGQLPASFLASDFIFTNTVSVSVHTTDGYDFDTLYDDMAVSAAQQTQNTTTHLFAVDAGKAITFEMIAANGSSFVLDANHLPTSGTIGEIDILDTTNLNDPTLLTQSHILVSTNGWIMPAASLFNAIGEYASANPATHTQGLTDLNNIFNAGKYSIVGSGGSQSNDGTPHDGADVFFGSNGADVFNGLGGPFGPGDHGSDTVDYSHATTGVTVSLAISGAQNTVGAGVDTLINIENLRGTDFNDTLTGDGNNNVLEGGLGTNALDGGGGNNTASYQHAAAAVTINLAIGGSQSSIGAGTDTLINIQNLRGSNFDDHLTGDNNANILTGGHGNDTLTGGGSNDTFIFVNGDGHDTIADFAIGQDKVDLTDGHTTAQVQALIDATTAGSNTLDLGNGNILTFTGIDVHNQLHAATDFLVH